MRRVVVLLAMAVILTAGCKEEEPVAEPVRPVRTYTVSGDGACEGISYPGRVEAAREASLAFRVPGQIVELNVREGDAVRQGQLIAMLDQRDFQAAVADLEAKLAGARSVYKEAKLNFDRNRKLLDSGTISQSDLDAAQSAFETSQATVRSYEQELRRARINFQYTRLEAPFDGVIAVKQVENHEYVQAKEEIVQLADITSLDIALNIPESIWARAFKGGDTDLGGAVARFETCPGREFPLRLKEYQTKADPETQTYEVTLTMDRPEGLNIHPGMTAEVSGRMTDCGTVVLSVPVSSVVGAPDGAKAVWILSNGTVSERSVRVGRIVEDRFLVHDGLEPGEVVVTAGVNYLREGQRVKAIAGRIGGRE